MKTINGSRMDLTGMRFGPIEVLEFVGTTKKGHAIYRIQHRTKGIYNEAAINLLKRDPR